MLVTLVAGGGGRSYLDSMEQPPFPIVLVVLVAFFAYLAATNDVVWIRVVAGLGALFVAAAAMFQSMPRRVDGEEMDDPLDGPPVDDPGAPL